MNKVIFFDIDGVLNRKSQWKRMYSLCDDCIREFSRFAAKECADIILMSSWRSGFVSAGSPQNSPQLAELECKFEKYRLYIADKTPVLRGRTRDREIERYLFLHDEIQSFAIIDDDPKEYGKKLEGLYFTDCAKGFSAADSSRIRFARRDALCI